MVNGEASPRTRREENGREGLRHCGRLVLREQDCPNRRRGNFPEENHPYARLQRREDRRSSEARAALAAAGRPLINVSEPHLSNNTLREERRPSGRELVSLACALAPVYLRMMYEILHEPRPDERVFVSDIPWERRRRAIEDLNEWLGESAVFYHSHYTLDELEVIDGYISALAEIREAMANPE